MIASDQTRAPHRRGRTGIRRAVLALVAAVGLLAGTSATTAYADNLVSLSCDDGTNLNLTLDTATLQELQESVSAMLLYPAGISCNVTIANLLTASILNLTGLARPVYADSAHDFAVGAQQFVGSNSGCSGNINFNLSAHAPSPTFASGSPTPNATQATGHMTANGQGGCAGSRLTADVDCLIVKPPVQSGSTLRAVVSGVIETGPNTPTGIFMGTDGKELNITIDDFSSPQPDNLATTIDNGLPQCSGSNNFQPFVGGNFVVKSGA